MKNWITYWFDLGKAEHFDKEKFNNIKYFLVLLCIIMAMFCSHNYQRGPNYLIKKNIYGWDAGLKDSIFYEVKGEVPIPKDRILDQLFLANAPQYSYNLPSVNLLDFLGTLVLTVLIFRYINFAHKKGIFNKAALKELLFAAVFCMVVNCIKPLVILLMSRNSDAWIPHSLDTNAYFGNGWLYLSFFLFTVINIFQYGRKLQEENELTV